MCETDVITSYTTKTVDNDPPSTACVAVMLTDPVALPFAIDTRHADSHSQIAMRDSKQPAMDGKATHVTSFGKGQRGTRRTVGLHRRAHLRSHRPTSVCRHDGRIVERAVLDASSDEGEMWDVEFSGHK